MTSQSSQETAAPDTALPDPALIDATTRIFRDLCDPQAVTTAVASGEDKDWQGALWTALEESGLTLAWVPEALGGAGVGIADGFAILEVSGRFAVPVPLAETMLAGWLLSAAGIRSAPGAMTVAPGRLRDRITLGSDGLLNGVARAVPFAASVDVIAVLAEKDGVPHAARVNAADCTIHAAPGLAGDGRDTVTFSDTPALDAAPLPDSVPRDGLAFMGATARAVQMGGALQAILTLATDYAGERVAFERKISKFQAVQHNLAQLAGETAAALAAAQSAADTLSRAGMMNGGMADAILLETAAAKIRAGEAAGSGAAIAHQVHGAIGFTEEHILHRFTQRLWSWRDDFGNESEWAVRLGTHVAKGGADALWPLLTSR